MIIKTTQEHFDKYAKLAKALGIEHLKALVPAKVEDLREHLEWAEEKGLLRDHQALNFVPLHKWDAQDCYVRNLYKEACRDGKLDHPGGWSLGDSVCTLKHVALYHVVGASFSPEKNP